VSPPSGEQFELAFEDQRVVVIEVGGGLRAYSAGDRQLLDGFGVDEMCSSGRGQVLIPWPNRIADGRYEFAGRQHQLPIDEHARKAAIHGLVRWSAWIAEEQDAQRIVLRYDLRPRPGYPFALALRIEYALSEGGLRVSTTATNAGVDPCPFGAGAHPYLLPGPPVDAANLRLPARSFVETDEHGIPIGTSSVAGTEFDFRQSRPIGPMALDDCFTDLERDDDGLARVVLARPELGTAVTLWVDDAYEYLMLYTGDDRPDVNRRSLAVEPMTCPPQAFRSGESVSVLAPGESATATWGLSPS
jgi:aldose 1-epimerase